VKFVRVLAGAAYYILTANGHGRWVGGVWGWAGVSGGVCWRSRRRLDPWARVEVDYFGAVLHQAVCRDVCLSGWANFAGLQLENGSNHHHRRAWPTIGIH